MNKLKISLSIALALVMLMSLAACGGGAQNDDPDLGIYEGVFVDIMGDGELTDISDFYDDESSIELKKGGKGTLILNGESSDLKWTLSGSNLTIKADGLEYTGKLKKGVIELDIFTILFTFAKEGAKLPSAKPVADDDDDDEKSPVGLTAAQEMWNGTWYGFLWIGDAFGEYADFTNEVFDAYMVLQIETNGKGNLSVFREDQEDATVGANITADENHFEVTEGMFWDMPLDSTDWWGGLSPISEGKYMVFVSKYVDPDLTEDDYFEYSFHFRPYGETWNESDGRLPPGYDAYLQALADGVPDPYGNQKPSGTGSNEGNTPGGNDGEATGLSNSLDTQWAVVYYPDTVEEKPDQFSPSRMTLVDKKGRFIMGYVDNGWGSAADAAAGTNDAYENDAAGDLYIEKTTIDGFEAWIVGYTGDSMGATVEVYIQYSDEDSLQVEFHHPEYSGKLADFQAIPEIWQIIDSIQIK